MPSSIIKIIIADDHPLIMQSLAFVLQREGGIELTAEAENGLQLCNLAEAHQPDVVLSDIQMPVMDGLTAIKALAASHPHIPVIAISQSWATSLVDEVMQAGAMGYIIKTADPQEIIEGIHEVLKGNTFFCSYTRARMDEYYKQQKLSSSCKNLKPLTEKEKEILHLTCLGHTSREIGLRLNLSARTVEDYNIKIQRKINTTGKTHMVIYGLNNGYGRQQP